MYISSLENINVLPLFLSLKIPAICNKVVLEVITDYTLERPGETCLLIHILWMNRSGYVILNLKSLK